MREWWEDWGRDMFMFVWVGTLVLAACAGGTAGLVFLVGPRSCAAHVAGSPLESRWSFWGGCQVKDARGVWIDPEQYRAIAAQP